MLHVFSVGLEESELYPPALKINPVIETAVCIAYSDLLTPISWTMCLSSGARLFLIGAEQ